MWTGWERTHQRAWVDLGLLAMGVVPATEFLGAVAPAAAGEHFDGLDADVAFPAGSQQGLGVAAVVGVEVYGGGKGEHDGVEVEAVEGLELDGGGEGAVAGDADVTGEAPVTHFDEGFDGAAGLGDLVEVVEINDGVELEEVEGLDAEAVAGRSGCCPRPLPGCGRGVLAPMNQPSSRRRGIQGAMCSMALP